MTSTGLSACAVAFTMAAMLTTGCRQQYRNDLDYSYSVAQTWQIDEVGFGELTQFDGVTFDLARTISLREAIVNDQIAANRNVLQIGTGTGLIASLCLMHDANSVVATDRQPAAVANADYNVAALSPDSTLDSRLRPASQQDAFSAIKDTEKFDLILIDLDRQVESEAQDVDAFIETLLASLNLHLSPGGRCLALSTQRNLLVKLQTGAKVNGIGCKTDDKRDLATLPVTFAPAMTLELR